MTETITLYYDPDMHFLHTVRCEVSESGSHTVKDSTICQIEPVRLTGVIERYRQNYGYANVRAYTIAPFHV